MTPFSGAKAIQHHLLSRARKHLPDLATLDIDGRSASSDACSKLLQPHLCVDMWRRIRSALACLSPRLIWAEASMQVDPEVWAECHAARQGGSVKLLASAIKALLKSLQQDVLFLVGALVQAQQQQQSCPVLLASAIHHDDVATQQMQWLQL